MTLEPARSGGRTPWAWLRKPGQSRRHGIDPRRRLFGLGVLSLVSILMVPAPAKAQSHDAATLALHRPSPLPFFIEEGARSHQRLIGIPEGDLNLQFLDALIPAEVMPLAVLREYRSALTREGVFGRGWTSNLDLHLVVDPATGVPTIREADGRMTAYRVEATDRFVPILEPIIEHDLLRERDGGWTRKWANGVTESFDRVGGIAGLARAADRIQFQYPDGSASEPAVLVDAAGYSLKLAFVQGLLTEVTDPLGRRTHYRYEDRRLAEVTDPIGRTTAFRYNKDRLSEMSLPDGGSLSFRYAAEGTVQEIAGPGALRTSFAWVRPKDGVTLQGVVTFANGTSETLRLGAGLLKFSDWGLSDAGFAGADGKVAGLQITRTDSASESATALLVGDKILVKSGVGSPVIGIDSSGKARAIENGRISSAAAEDTAMLALESRPAWRSRLTPGSFRAGHSGVIRDAAGRPVEIPAGSANKEVWEWDAADRLVAWKDIDGRPTSYQYDANDHLVTVSEEDRLLLRAEYDAAGLLSSVHNSGGDISFTYDGAGNLLEVRGPRGKLDLAYDTANRLISANGEDGALKLSYDARGLLERFVGSDGHTTLFAYDDKGRLVTESRDSGERVTYAYDALGRTSSVGYPDKTITYSYDAESSLARTAYAGGHEVIEKRSAAGRTTTVKLAGGPEITAQYDKLGRPVEIRDSTGSATAYSYDEKNRLSAQKDANGNTKNYRYDDSGRLAEISDGRSAQSFQYDAQGETDTLTENGRRSELHYDRAGRLVARRDPEGNETRYEYTATGALAATLSPGGARLDYQHDAAGRVISIVHSYRGQRAAIAYAYDPAGRLARYTREDGTTESYTYDASGRLAERTSPIGNQYRYHYDDQGRTTAIDGPFGAERFTYDARGRIVERSDPVEGTMRFEYSDLPNTITIIDQGGGRTRVSLSPQGQPLEIEDPEGGKTIREYDDAGRLIAFSDPNGNRTSWSYDDKGRSVERRTPLGKLYRYRYDERGNLTETTLPDGQVIRREYDAADRLVRLVPGAGDSWTYRYDSRGRVQSVESAVGAFSYVYDDLDRATEYRDAFGNVVGLTYDAAGRRESLRMPGGEQLHYVYNAQGLLGAVETKSGAITYAYDKAGRLSTITYPNGVTVTQEYWAGTRLKSVAATSARGVTLFRETYEYDPRGNVVAVTDGGEVPAPQDLRDKFRRSMGVTRYSYDTLSRVVAASYPDGTEERFNYDADGNLILATRTGTDTGGGKFRAETPYAYDADQALVAQGPFKATPDASGNFCGDWDRSDCDFRYDAFNRLTAWHDQAYRHDGEGRLLDWRDGKGEGARYTYLGQNLLAETAQQGGPPKVYIPTADGLRWSAIHAGDQAFYPLRSANGSLLAVFDRQGEIAASCLYRAYGVALSWSKITAGPGCEYAGGRLRGPGFWFGTRVLHAIGQRFMSPDPTGPDKDGSLYTYALDNPLRFTDAMGTTSVPIGGSPPLTWLPQSEKAVLNKLEQIATSEAGTPAGDVAKDLLDRVGTGEVTPWVYNVGPKGMGVAGAAPVVPQNTVTRFYSENTVARVYMEPIMAKATAKGTETSALRQAVATLAHEGTHVGQNIVPGAFENPYRMIHELEAELNAWKIDPTFGDRRPWTPTEIVDSIAENYKGIAPGSSTIREKQVFQGVVDQVDRLKQLRGAQVAEGAERLPLAGAAESAASDGVVERMLAREAVELGAAAEKGAARRLAETILGAAKRYFPGEAIKEVLLPGLLELAEPIGTLWLAKDLTEMAVKAAAWAGTQLGNLIAKPLEDAFKQLDNLNTPEEQQARKRRRAAAADRMLGPTGETLIGPLLVDTSNAGDQTASASGQPGASGNNAGGGSSTPPTTPSGQTPSASNAGASASGAPRPPIANQPLGEPPPASNAGASGPGAPRPSIANQPLGEPPPASTNTSSVAPPSSGSPPTAPASPAPPSNTATSSAMPSQPGAGNKPVAATTTPGNARSAGPGNPQPTTGQPAPATAGATPGQPAATGPAPSSSTSSTAAGSPPTTRPPATTAPGRVASGGGPAAGPGAQPAAPPRSFPLRPRSRQPNTDTSDEDQSAGAPDSGQSSPAPSGTGGIVGALNRIGNQTSGAGAGRGSGGGGGLPPPPPPPVSQPQPPQPPITQPQSPQPPTEPPPPTTGSNEPNGGSAPTPPEDEGLPTTGLPPPPPPAPPAPPTSPAPPTPPQIASNDKVGTDAPPPTTPAPPTPPALQPPPSSGPSAGNSGGGYSPPASGTSGGSPPTTPVTPANPSGPSGGNSEGGLLNKILRTFDWIIGKISGK